MSLARKKAVVTGGARGIGYAYAERLAADGADVAVIDIDDPSESVAALPGDGRKLGLACDLSDTDRLAHTVDAILRGFGRVDILVNSAGMFPATTLETVTLDVWRRVQAVNVEPVLTLAQAFVPGMKARSWGRIVTTGSANTLLGGKDLAYLTSKAGVHGLTRALANELGEYGITVNAIAPSVVATEGFLGRTRATGVTADQVFARVSAQQSIKRPSVPADLGNALGFLVSDAAGFITGQILHVDGGLTRSGA